MILNDEEKIREIWLAGLDETPVLYREKRPAKLFLRMPYNEGNFAWLRNGKLRKPKWKPKGSYWELPAKWFDELVERLIHRYGAVHIIQPYNEQEKCAPACMRAKGHECECSCMGANHGAGGPNSSWLVISNEFATRWRSGRVACRLLSKRAN